MINQNNNSSQSKTSKVLNRDNVQLSTQDCNDWIKNNLEKIVNLYLQAVLDLKKKSVQTALNELARKERAQNTSKFMAGDSLNRLKELTQQHQISFSDWKQESKISSSKVSSIAKKINPIQIESVEQFLKRGGEIKRLKNRRNAAV